MVTRETDTPAGTPPRDMPGAIARVGIGGPVGSGKTALIERLVPIFLEAGFLPLVVTNDIVTVEDAMHVRATLEGIIPPEQVVGVETGACPHTAIREDPTMNLAAIAELEQQYPQASLVFLESGGDNLTLTFSPALADYFVYVIDVAAGDKIPRKNGPGITNSDLLVINKTDLAPMVGASLDVMQRDATAMRSGKPTLFTNCRTGEGTHDVATTIASAVLFTELPRDAGS